MVLLRGSSRERERERSFCASVREFLVLFLKEMGACTSKHQHQPLPSNVVLQPHPLSSSLPETEAETDANNNNNKVFSEEELQELMIEKEIELAKKEEEEFVLVRT